MGLSIKRIGILTGGGDVPGLNSCIRSVVDLGVEQGWEILGFRRGWAGPLSVDLDDYEFSIAEHAIPLDKTRVRTIDRTGGTMLHTSRTDPAHLKVDDLGRYPHLGELPRHADGSFDATGHIIKVLERAGVDAMVTLGGDGTLRFSAHLSALGVPVVSVPKTMDNDVFGTDYCIGFSTAVSRSVDAITMLRTTVCSHERIGIVELFGRRSGETALISGYLAHADRIAVSEVPVDGHRLGELLAQDRAQSPNGYAMLVVSEGASIKGEDRADDIALPAANRTSGSIGRRIGDLIRAETGIGVVIQELAYLMRSGQPDALDRMVSMAYGTLAVQLLARGEHGVMTALCDGNYCAVPAEQVLAARKQLDIAQLYDKEQYQAKIAAVLGKAMFLS